VCFKNVVKVKRCDEMCSQCIKMTKHCDNNFVVGCCICPREQKQMEMCSASFYTQSSAMHFI